MGSAGQARNDGSLRGIQWGDAAILAALLLFAFNPWSLAEPALVAIGASLVGACLLRVRGLNAVPAAVAGCLCLYGGLAWDWYPWPAYLLIPLVAAASIACIVGARPELVAAMRLGRLGRRESLLILVIASTAGVALLAWVEIVEPDLSKFRSMLPRWPIAALVLAGLGFSIVNAILEEFLWRGVIQNWLLSITTRSWAVAVQALSFGAAHYLGFPGGAVGAVLATLYGAMVGALALRSGGLLAPIVAHIGADAVIFALVAGSLQTSQAAF